MNQEEARDRAIESYYEGYRHQVNGRLAEATARYEQSIALYPTAEAHAHLAWIIGTQGRFDEAIEECKRAIALDADYGNPYNDIGFFLIEMGRHRDAIPWLQKAASAKRYDHPSYPHFNLGRAWEKVGGWWQALEAYRRALEISPDFDAARLAHRRLAARLN